MTGAGFKIAVGVRSKRSLRATDPILNFPPRLFRTKLLIQHCLHNPSRTSRRLLICFLKK